MRRQVSAQCSKDFWLSDFDCIKIMFVSHLTFLFYLIKDLAVAGVTRPSDGCPIGSYGCDNEDCPNTCFCGDHCSWRKCKLEKPPQSCLIHSNNKWVYDFDRNFWKSTLDGN